MRKEFALLVLPLVTILGTSCANKPDVSSFLKLQCETNPNLETAHQRIEMIPDQEISVGGESFKLTPLGRLKYSSSLELRSGNVIGSGLYYGNIHYTIETSKAEDTKNTIVDISCNCKNPSEGPK